MFEISNMFHCLVLRESAKRTVAGRCHYMYEYRNTLQNHFKILTTHFKILTTHFKILTTHSAQAHAQCRAVTKALISTFNIATLVATMFCSLCGNQLRETDVFCSACGRMVENPEAQAAANNEEEREAIESYFLAGYEYETILCFLSKYHGINHSMSTLKRRLREYGLKRKNAVDIDDNDIAEAIQQELQGPSSVSGYRSMWHTLRLKYGMCVPRDKVQRILKELNPNETEERKHHRLKRRTYRSNGPNECWHVDGYDKLKPFGFPIHGAVDGYSRYVFWLKVARTNNNPVVIANYYVECVKELQGCPRVLRTDPGAENGTMAAIQCYLRANDDDDYLERKLIVMALQLAINELSVGGLILRKAEFLGG